MSTMKILLLYRDSCDREITSSVVSGGGEQFCKLIDKNFDVEVYQGLSKAEQSWSTREKSHIQKSIVKKAEEMEADIIVSNFPSSIYNGKHIIGCKIPVMIVMHNRFKMMSIFSRLNKAVEKGHSVFLVSEHQKEYYQEASDRQHEKWPDDDSNLMCDVAGYIRPSYCIGEKPKIKDKFNYECGTIGRCDNQKKPFLLKELTSNDNLVITSMAQEDGKNGYYNRMKRKYKGDKNVSWSDTHDNLMKKLSTCKTYFSSWSEETFGICTLEALSHGIPVILNSDADGQHASTIITDNSNHYRLIKNNDKDELLEAIKSFDDVDRQQIQDEIWEKHSKEKWINHMKDAFEKTIDTFNKKNH